MNDYIDIVGTVGGSLGYAGMTDNGSKVNWGLNLTGDLVIARIVSLGFNYRLFSAQGCSTNWSMDYDSSMYYLIKPPFEIKLGICALIRD